MLGILVAQLGGHAQFHRVAVFRRQLLAVIRQGHDGLRMQGRGHVDARKIIVGALETDVFGRRVGAHPLEEVGKRHAAPLADGAPAFHADVARHLRFLRQGAQLRQAPRLLVGDQAAQFQPPGVAIDLFHLVFAVIRVEGKRPRDHGIGIRRRQFMRVEQPALHPVIHARDGRQGGLDAGRVIDVATGQQRQAAQSQAALQEQAARRLLDPAQGVGQHGLALLLHDDGFFHDGFL